MTSLYSHDVFFFFVVFFYYYYFRGLSNRNMSKNIKSLETGASLMFSLLLKNLSSQNTIKYPMVRLPWLIRTRC